MRQRQQELVDTDAGGTTAPAGTSAPGATTAPGGTTAGGAAAASILNGDIKCEQQYTGKEVHIFSPTRNSTNSDTLRPISRMRSILWSNARA